MIRTRSLFVVSALGFALAAPGPGQDRPGTRDRDFAAARSAWDRGDYLTALNGLIGLLERSDDSTLREQIALLTGEPYRVHEVATDGRRVRLSGDGRFVAYQVPAPRGRRSAGTGTRVVELGDEMRTVAELSTADFAFSPVGARMVTIAAGRDELTVHDLETGEKAGIQLGELRVASARFGPEGKSIYCVAAKSGQTDRTDVFVIRPFAAGAWAPPQTVTDSEGYKVDPIPLSGGKLLLYGKSARNPVPPAARGTSNAGRRVVSRRRFRPSGSREFVIVDLDGGATRELKGSGLTVARGGSMLAFSARAESGATSLKVMRTKPGAEPQVVLETAERLGSFALSPDGMRLAFQHMPMHDWEISVIELASGEVRRVTREIQHDLNPTFLDDRTVMAVMGEPRHRRAHVYDLKTGVRRRIFHNNTIRTIAPQYEWVPSANGRAVAIVAERDGNTVTPDRGVYVVDLGQRVSGPQLLARLKAQRAGERDLRERGTAMFAPIATDVRRVTEAVAVDRVYGYLKSLHDCGTRYVSRPGNKRGAEYLAKAFRSFGYEPELQTFKPRSRRGGGGGESSNVVAVLKGTVHPELVYVIGSHYDSVTRGPGADDNASGTSVTLEAARVLAEHPQAATIVFACFTGEEAGLLGSREFVRRAAEDKMQVVGALNNDMLGWANDFRLDNTIRYSNPGIRDVQHAGAIQFSRLITYDALYYKGTDAAAFYSAWGDIVGGIGSYPVLGNPHYHQATDLLDTINFEQVAETCKTTVATLMLLASSPSRLTGLKAGAPGDDGVTVTWAPSPERDVVGYEVVYRADGAAAESRMDVTEAKAVLRGAGKGGHVAVRARNKRGLHGWDWARSQL